jgi:hypothetical protein
MKSRMLVVLALAVLVGCAGNGVAQDAEKKEVARPRKVPPELMQKAQEKGLVTIIVDLDFPVQPESGLSKDAAAAQRQSIFEAQEKLLAELVGTKYKVTGRLKTLPGIGLQVGPDALRILERSTLVKKITEDFPQRPL